MQVLEFASRDTKLQKVELEFASLKTKLQKKSESLPPVSPYSISKA